MKGLRDYLTEVQYLLGDNRSRLGWLVGLFLLSSFLDIAGLGLIGPYLALAMNPALMSQGRVGSYLDRMNLSMPANEALMILGVGLVLIFLFKATAAVFINWQILKFSRECRVDVQAQLMRAYQRQPYIDYAQRNSSEYMKTIYDATGQYVSSVEVLLRMLSEGIISMGVLTFLAVTNGKVLGVLVLLLGSVMLVYDRFFRRKAKIYGQKAAEESQQIIQGIHEGFVGFKELRILGKSDFFHRAVIQGARALSANWTKATLISISPRYLMEFILVSFVILFVLIALVSGGDASQVLPTLAVFAVASLRLLPSINLLAGGLTKLSFGRHAVSLLYQDLKRVERYRDMEFEKSPAVPARDLFEMLTLENVSFQYPRRQDRALHNVTLTIKAGESVGMIGPSGSGKTTLVDLLLGLLEPQEGRILYNGRSLQEAIAAWRSQVAYLPQEIFLIDNTLRRNIALGLEDADIDEARVQEAIQHSQLTELLHQLPRGVDTVIGERGVRISGGQRQRVALARAFYFERNVLVLDEATSSLDQATEHEIVEEIKRLKGRKTLIVIAHRLSTVRHCDRIYRIQQGEIVEAGSYDAVVGKSG